MENERDARAKRKGERKKEERERFLGLKRALLVMCNEPMVSTVCKPKTPIRHAVALTSADEYACSGPQPATSARKYTGASRVMRRHQKLPRVRQEPSGASWFQVKRERVE